MITWSQRVANLRIALGRDPSFDELIDVASIHRMTPAELREQAESFARGMSPCEHGIADFEDCQKCREKICG